MFWSTKKDKSRIELLKDIIEYHKRNVTLMERIVLLLTDIGTRNENPYINKLEKEDLEKTLDYIGKTNSKLYAIKHILISGM